MSGKVCAIIAWEKPGEETARRLAEQYHRAGLDIVVHGEEAHERIVALGEAMEMSHVLFFLDEQWLLFTNYGSELGTFTLKVQVNELVQPGTIGDKK